MLPSRASYDVVIAGAGPAGATAAIAHARRGARVLVCEADPRAARRFAGEWLHPTGVAVLDALRIGRLESARPRSGYGFVILPDDHGPPIEMPYTDGVALSAEHSTIVEAIREVARDEPGVELLEHTRVVAVDRGDVHIECKRTRASAFLRARRVIGADGKRSTVRQSAGFEDASTPLSYMASVELRDVTLPFEGFGHVVLGGPGPALFYRISDDVVRGCLDIPIALGPRARSVEFLWDGFGRVLEEPLRTALKAALERGVSGWAINRFRPRTDFGRDEVRLVGDALGHVHPMTAMGMTLGLLDAHALAETESVREYAAARRSYIPELLSNALYHCFRRDDPSATAVRRAMFETLRGDAEERRRTMDILAGSEPRRRAFGSSFLRIAAQAVGSELKGAVRDGGLKRLPGALAGFGEWMQWPAALVVPEALDPRVRRHSSPTHPIPQLETLVPTAAPLDPPAADEIGQAAHEVSLGEAIDAGTKQLLGQLETIAMRVGSVPDVVLAGPALSCMRAIVQTRMGVAMAARMSLGRRRLAVDGLPRLLASGDPACQHLAGLLIVLLDGASWRELPIAALPEGIRALVDCQSQAGGFVSQRGANGEGDAELTALACRALDVARRRCPDSTDVDLERVLDRAGAWLKARQDEDGGWPTELGADPVSRVAFGLEGLVYAGEHPGDPAVRRAIQWIDERADAVRGVDTGELSVDARALRALVLAQASTHDTIVRTARRLADALLGVEQDAPPSSDWEIARELVEALAVTEQRRASSPRRKRSAPTRRVEVATAPAIPAALEDDWAFAKESLEAVSRTFSRPIAMLPPRLEVAVTLGYLLCRIADTIEDHVAVLDEDKDPLFRLFLACLAGDRPAHEFEQELDARVDGDDAELALSRNLTRVMRIFAAQPEPVRDACVRWVSEMTRGMSLYVSRRPGADGMLALHTVADLERYCFYVAGTVGHLLTDLFLHEMGVEEESPEGLALRDRAEGFATGLQLTNILKDVTDDFARAVSFVPRTECTRHGFSVAALTDEAHREDAHRAVAPLFDLARSRLDEAFEYALQIPAEQTEIRLFCLLPLWMAARSLENARGNDAMFEAGRPVKISRSEVESLIAECVRLAGDDAGLEARYARLYDARSVAEVG